MLWIIQSPNTVIMLLMAYNSLAIHPDRSILSVYLGYSIKLWLAVVFLSYTSILFYTPPPTPPSLFFFVCSSSKFSISKQLPFEGKRIFELCIGCLERAKVDWLQPGGNWGFKNQAVNEKNHVLSLSTRSRLPPSLTRPGVAASFLSSLAFPGSSGGAWDCVCTLSTHALFLPRACVMYVNLLCFLTCECASALRK